MGTSIRFCSPAWGMLLLGAALPANPGSSAHMPADTDSAARLCGAGNASAARLLGASSGPSEPPLQGHQKLDQRFTSAHSSTKSCVTLDRTERSRGSIAQGTLHKTTRPRGCCSCVDKPALEELSAPGFQDKGANIDAALVLDCDVQDLPVLVNLMRQHVGCPKRVLATSPAEQYAESKTLSTLQTAEASSCLGFAQIFETGRDKGCHSFTNNAQRQPNAYA